MERVYKKHPFAPPIEDFTNIGNFNMRLQINIRCLTYVNMVNSYRRSRGLMIVKGKKDHWGEEDYIMYENIKDRVGLKLYERLSSTLWYYLYTRNYIHPIRFSCDTSKYLKTNKEASRLDVMARINLTNIGDDLEAEKVFVKRAVDRINWS